MPSAKSWPKRRSALSRKLQDIAKNLETLSFDRDVWGEALAALRSAFGAAVTGRYLPERVGGGWSFESMDIAAGTSACSVEFRSRVLPVLSKQFGQDGFYDALLPDAHQRNRVLLLPEITRATGRSPAAMQEFMVSLGIGRWDQLRVLVCDGPRLLSWVGVLSEHQFSEADRAALQQLVPACRARLRFDQLARHAAHANAALEATLEAVPVPCFLLHASGRVLEANTAGRLLRDGDPELFARVGELVRQPDPRFELHPIEVCGVTASYLATLRAPSCSAREPLAARARGWSLTRRQTTVLACIVAGLANKEIASRLDIAPGTVELHVSAILAKAHAESRSALVAAYWSGTEPASPAMSARALRATRRFCDRT
jgi:DNA-binding CsgD family transcriptional regulator/PAS domain-containing protein